MGVFLAYAGQHGRALLDRELYLPREWTNDHERRQTTKIPEHVPFQTKPQLAQQMIERAVAADVPFAWIAGDEVYGDNWSLRVWLEQNDLHFVLAVRSNQYVWTERVRQETVEQLGKAVTEDDWQMLSAGDGTKGPRWYDWARVPLLSWQMPGERWLLLRRSRSDGKLAYYVCYVPPGTQLQTMVQVAGMRWMIEECFEAAKGEVGLDRYEVRSWHGWYRHITLAMVAHAFLAAECTSTWKSIRSKKPDATADGELETATVTYIALTVQEIRKLLCRLVWRVLPEVGAVIHWSLWRRGIIRLSLTSIIAFTSSLSQSKHDLQL